MPWESEEQPVREGRDWAKLMWLGVAAIIAVGLVLLFVPRESVVAETRARVKHILVPLGGLSTEDIQAAVDTARSLRDRIVTDGQSFSKVAEDYSADQRSARRGGDLGWVRRGELGDVLDQYIWTAPIDQVSQPIISEYGVHLVVVTEREIADAERYERELKERVLQERGGDRQ